LQGATVLTATQLERLVAAERPVLLDVVPRQPTPANRPEGSIWVEPQRLDIPGSRWLPNVGYGYLPAPTLGYLRDSLAALTDGDKSRPLVFYCDPDCWMSWNAAKRTIEELGYTNVYWFPGGAAGWAAAGHELANAQIYRPEAAGLSP
jgi:PQQ-dependent catabolism-associated CXXCW motif protein